DLPEPERPVITVSVSRGISTSISLRLCSRAPRTLKWVSIEISVPDLFLVYRRLPQASTRARGRWWRGARFARRPDPGEISQENRKSIRNRSDRISRNFALCYPI